MQSNHFRQNSNDKRIEECKLSLPLKILFALNGATIQFPTLADMAIINDRAKIPLNILSAYGALTFLPWSFKPIYAFVASALTNNSFQKDVKNSTLQKCGMQCHNLIALLLFGSGIAIAMTSFVPEGGVKICFILAIIRSILTAFPEFLLGLALVDEARAAMIMSNDSEIMSGTNTTDYNKLSRINIDDKKKKSFNKVSGMFQAQAATSRNIGALLSSIVLFLLLIVRYTTDNSNDSNDSDGTNGEEAGQKDQLTNQFVLLMLLSTSMLPIIGAFIAWRYKVGSPLTIFQKQKDTEAYGTLSSSDNFNDDNMDSDRADLHAPSPDLSIGIDFKDQNDKKVSHFELEPSSQEKKGVLSKSDVGIVVSFQILIILFGLKTVIVHKHPTLWQNLTVIFTITLLSLALYRSFIAWKKRDSSYQDLIQRGPALFLILRHAMPNVSYQWSSFTYHLFHAQPIYIQILSLVGNIMTTCGSKVYEKYIAPRFSNLMLIFVVTTILSTMISFLYLIPAHFSMDNDTDRTRLHHFLIVLMIGICSSFFSEMEFLPSIVLATNSVQNVEPSDLEPKAMDDEGEDESFASANQELSKRELLVEKKPNNLLAVEYGTYVACIDFGDQLASWITVPIISALAINRGDWSRLGDLVAICAGLNMVPLLFLWLVPADIAGWKWSDKCFHFAK